MAMALDMPVDQVVPASVLQPHLPAPEHAIKAKEKATAVVSHRHSGDIGINCQEQETGHPTDIEDDEVQFVFSVPRRRRKKRKRTESIYKSASDTQESKVLRRLPTSTSTSSPTSPIIRRGSTGMVQLLDSCHMSENIPFANKGGSLPAISPGPRELSSTNNIQPQQTSPWPFADGSSWWDIQTPHTNHIGSFQFDICGMPFAEEIVKKMKPDGEPDGLEPGPKLNPLQRSPDNQAAANHGKISTYENSNLSGLHSLPLDICMSEGLDIACGGWQSAPTSRLASPLGPPNTFLQPWRPAASSRNRVMIDQAGDQSSLVQKSHQSGSPTERSLSDLAQQQFIQVPVSFMPELSVSPRTKTVQVFRQANLDILQLHGTPSRPFITQSMPPPTPPCDQPPTYYGEAPINLISKHAGHNIPSQTQARLPPSETTVHDILRKPSLYKIPPWPSSPVSHLPQSLCDSNPQIENELMQGPPSPTRLLDQRSTIRPTVNTVSSGWNDSTQSSLPLSRNMKPQDSRPVPPCSQASNTPSKANPGLARSSPFTRKHSPNLIVDIAETCQEHFPFAAVAERHNQPIQKVFDTFSAIIQLPLLRSAADHRRHGDLAKSRMKEFREAKRARDKAQGQGRKKVIKDASRGETGGGPAPKMPKSAPELLRAAILNNARSKED